MENIIIVFNNRNYTMQLATYLKRMGINCKTIDTPRELTVSCGLSLVISKINYQRVVNIIRNANIKEMPRMFVVFESGPFKKYKAL